MDVFEKSKRSEVMSKVRSKGNLSTEKKLIRLFKLNNIKGWRRNYIVYGKPDFVFLKQRIAVFADGCFWHGHNCGRNLTPSSNVEYWEAKNKRNKKRDKKVNKILKEKKWTVIRIWECQIKKGNIKKLLTVLVQKGI